MEHKMKNAVGIRAKRLQCLSVLRGPLLGLRSKLGRVSGKAVGVRGVAVAGLLVIAGRV
jgi:hypothetical protein